MASGQMPSGQTTFGEMSLPNFRFISNNCLILDIFENNLVNFYSVLEKKPA
jgi:hypothetical protein